MIREDKRGVSRLTCAVAVIVVVVIIAAAYFTLMPPQPSPTPSPSPSPSPSPTPSPSPSPSPTVSARDTIRIAIGIDLDTVDPHGQTTTLVYNVIRHVYETLLWFDDKGNVIPWLAVEWEVSSDGLEYTFKLRKGVKFHDGVEFDAYAVKANFDRWINPTTRVPLRAHLGPINKTEIIDRYTVKVILKKPYAPFLRALANYLLICSPKVLEKFGNQTVTEPVGTGPFVFKKWEKGKEIVLERFEDYWSEKPKVKKLVWKIIPEAGTREAALLAGDVDFVFRPPASDVKMLDENPNIKVLAPVTNRIIFVAINPRGPLANPKVRQALNYAIDKEAIIKNVLFGLGVIADSPVPPHFFGYHKMPLYEYNPEKAKQLLAEAGYPEGFKIVLLHPTGRYTQDKQVAEAIQAYLMDIGLDVELRTMDWPSFVRAIVRPLEEKDYDMVLIGWGPGVADAHFTLYPQFHSEQQTPHGLGLAHYNNSLVDQLLEQAMCELNESVRKDLYRQAIETIWQDAPWIFLYTEKVPAAMSVNLEGVWIHPDGEQFYFFYAYFKS